MNKTTLEALNDLLAQYGAKVSVKNSLLQSKADGYIGEQFKDSNKPVYDFDVIGVSCGESFSNVKSSIYQKIPKDLFFNSYFETSQRIYC
jgi:hypothetical protein